MKIAHNIETERMIIRPYRNSDMAFCISLWCDPENGKYMKDPSINCLNERYIKCFENMENANCYYLIATDKKTGEALGTCCLYPKLRDYDIGYCISKHHWKEGFGSELIQALITLAKNMDGKAITAEVADENIASINLLKKFNFKPCKVLSFRKWNSNKIYDSHLYKLIL